MSMVYKPDYQYNEHVSKTLIIKTTYPFAGTVGSRVAPKVAPSGWSRSRSILGQGVRDVVRCQDNGSVNNVVFPFLLPLD